jgi:hypothetical protein
MEQIVKVWELRNGQVDETATLVYANDDEMRSGMFAADGKPVEWHARPTLEVFVEPRRKKPKPRADISALQPGALVLNSRAYQVLGSVLAPFGQLLEVNVDGAIEYFYNVTNVVDCIDPDSSVKRGSGAISKEAFFDDKVPTSPAIFKDPKTARSRIYANDAVKEFLVKLIAEAGLVGALFCEPGAASTRAR